MQIFIVKDEAQTGPFTKNQIDEMLSSGMISRDVMAWKEGVSDWQPLHTILSAPPPLPLPQSSNETVSETVNPTATALDGPKGVGGWLRFFCVGITILGPIHSLRQFSEARMD